MISRQYSYVIDSRCIENKGGDLKLSRELYISSKLSKKIKDLVLGLFFSKVSSALFCTYRDQCALHS